MKTSKTIITAIIILLAIPAMAQGNFNDRLFDAKVCEITNRLNLSAEQVKQFRPVYEKYNKAMISAWGNKEKPQKPQPPKKCRRNSNNVWSGSNGHRRYALNMPTNSPKCSPRNNCKSSTRWKTPYKTNCAREKTKEKAKHLCADAEQADYINTLNIQ